MDIAVLIFDRITALDAVGPYEVLSRLPGATVRFVAAERGAKRADTGFLSLVADYGLDDVVEPDVLVVPGGPGTRDLLENGEILDWIRTVHATTRWTTSVCTGAMMLGAAGVLQGRRATTHWAAVERLSDYGAHAAGSRVVEDGKVITAAGVSAGIDLGLRLVQLATGDDLARAIQLVIEYDPLGQFDAGSPSGAGPGTVALAQELLRTPFATAAPPKLAGEPTQSISVPASATRARTPGESGAESRGALP